MANMSDTKIGKFNGTFSRKIVSVPEKIMKLIFAGKNGKRVDFRAVIEQEDYPFISVYDLSRHPNIKGFKVSLSPADNRLAIPAYIQERLRLMNGEYVSFCYLEGVLEVHRFGDLDAGEDQRKYFWRDYVQRDRKK